LLSVSYLVITPLPLPGFVMPPPLPAKITCFPPGCIAVLRAACVETRPGTPYRTGWDALPPGTKVNTCPLTVAVLPKIHLGKLAGREDKSGVYAELVGVGVGVLVGVDDGGLTNANGVPDESVKAVEPKGKNGSCELCAACVSVLGLAEVDRPALVDLLFLYSIYPSPATPTSAAATAIFPPFGNLRNSEIPSDIKDISKTHFLG